MTQYIKEVNSVSPSNFVHDFNEIAAEPGPTWMSFDYWVSVDDAAAGAFSMEVHWLDPTSNTIVKSGSTISLTDPTGHNQEFGVFSVQRFSGTSLWEAAATLIGPAASSLISYRIMLQKEPVAVDWP